MTKSVKKPGDMETDSVDIDALLTGGYLSGEDHDAIRTRVLDRVAPAKRAGWGRWAAISAAALSAAAALSLLLSRPEGFTAKGMNPTSSVEIEVACDGPVETECRRGDKLLFIVRAPSAGYLGAYAERLDDPTHSRIWYFPSRDGQTVRVGGNREQREVASEGIRIGSEHEPGRYRVSAWLTEQPLQREELAGGLSESLPGLSVREIEVVP